MSPLKSYEKAILCVCVFVYVEEKLEKVAVSLHTEFYTISGFKSKFLLEKEMSRYLC